MRSDVPPPGSVRGSAGSDPAGREITTYDAAAAVGDPAAASACSTDMLPDSGYCPGACTWPKTKMFWLRNFATSTLTCGLT